MIPINDHEIKGSCFACIQLLPMYLTVLGWRLLTLPAHTQAFVPYGSTVGHWPVLLYNSLRCIVMYLKRMYSVNDIVPKNYYYETDSRIFCVTAAAV